MKYPHLYKIIGYIGADNGIIETLRDNPEWPEEVNLGDLEELASDLDDAEKEFVAAGEHGEVSEYLRQFPYGEDLYRFLDEVYDGIYIDNFWF